MHYSQPSLVSSPILARSLRPSYSDDELHRPVPLVDPLLQRQFAHLDCSKWSAIPAFGWKARTHK